MTMPSKQDERIVLVRDKGRITIPAALRDRYGMTEGSEVVLIAEEDRLVLYPRRVQQVEALLDEIADALRAKGITLKELLSDSRAMRAEALRKQHPERPDPPARARPDINIAG
jgi:AbrB family looped-hinge helix DNA binding protein